jgi:microcystin-dependent protein
MPTTSKNLGQVAAVIPSPTAPTNTNVVWLDTSGSTTIKKIWDPIALAWIPLTQSGTVAGDNWGTQVVVSDATLVGQGTTGTPLKIAQQAATSGQVLGWSGSTWHPVNQSTGGITSVATDTTLIGNGTVGTPLKIAQQAANPGQALVWNGTTWSPAFPTISGLFSRGMIMMWSGTIATIPSGWVLCDGTNGTPSMAGMFVVNYNASDGDYNAIGNTGGSKTVALTDVQNGPHNHGVNDPGHTHPLATGVLLALPGTGPWSGGGPNPGGTSTLGNTGSNSTGITIQDSGTGAPHENRPPYYVLAYIMKT